MRSEKWEWVRVSILILNIYTLNISWNKMSGTRNSFSHLTVEKTRTHTQTFILCWCLTLDFDVLVILCLSHIHSERAPLSFCHILYISRCVSSAHSNNALARSFSPFLFFCILHTQQYKYTHTNKYLMPVRPTESNVRTMIGIRLQVVSIIMIAAFNPYAYHKSNFVSRSSNSMLLIFTFYLDAAVAAAAAAAVAFISVRRLAACFVLFRFDLNRLFCCVVIEWVRLEIAI